MQFKALEWLQERLAAEAEKNAAGAGRWLPAAGLGAAGVGLVATKDIHYLNAAVERNILYFIDPVLPAARAREGDGAGPVGAVELEVQRAAVLRRSHPHFDVVGAGGHVHRVL